MHFHAITMLIASLPGRRAPGDASEVYLDDINWYGKVNCRVHSLHRRSRIEQHTESKLSTGWRPSFSGSWLWVWFDQLLQASAAWTSRHDGLYFELWATIILPPPFPFFLFFSSSYFLFLLSFFPSVCSIFFLEAVYFFPVRLGLFCIL